MAQNLNIELVMQIDFYSNVDKIIWYNIVHSMTQSFLLLFKDTVCSDKRVYFKTSNVNDCSKSM